MTIKLNQPGTDPQGLEIKAFGDPMAARMHGFPDEAFMRIGDAALGLEDFCALVEYGLTNTNLEMNDPRRALIERLQKAEILKGYPSIANGVTTYGKRIHLTPATPEPTGPTRVRPTRRRRPRPHA